jgi:hypothetical protein
MEWAAIIFCPVLHERVPVISDFGCRVEREKLLKDLSFEIVLVSQETAR